jgi:hypothetical protein
MTKSNSDAFLRRNLLEDRGSRRTVNVIPVVVGPDEGACKGKLQVFGDGSSVNKWRICVEVTRANCIGRTHDSRTHTKCRRANF